MPRPPKKRIEYSLDFKQKVMQLFPGDAEVVRGLATGMNVLEKLNILADQPLPFDEAAIGAKNNFSTEEHSLLENNASTVSEEHKRIMQARILMDELQDMVINKIFSSSIVTR